MSNSSEPSMLEKLAWDFAESVKSFNDDWGIDATITRKEITLRAHSGHLSPRMTVSCWFGKTRLATCRGSWRASTDLIEAKQDMIQGHSNIALSNAVTEATTRIIAGDAELAQVVFASLDLFDVTKAAQCELLRAVSRFFELPPAITKELL